MNHSPALLSLFVHRFHRHPLGASSSCASVSKKWPHEATASRLHQPVAAAMAVRNFCLLLPSSALLANNSRYKV